jgi:predicted secreted protein
MGAHVGRDVLIEFAIADETASPGGLTYKTLGMMRGKGMKVSWDTADTTADDSPAFTKTNLVTFKSVEFSGDGVTYSDALYNQAEFKGHVYNPGSGTANQPKVWLRQTDPSGVTEGPFIVNEWSDDAPYSDAATWSMSAMSNGSVTFTPA